MSAFKEDTHKITDTIIDIIHSTTSGDSRQGRPRGGEATEWHPREPQAPEGKGTATLKFCTAARLKCWGHMGHCATRPTRKQENVRGRRLALSTTALRSPPMHRRTAFEGKSLGFSVKRRESCGGPELMDRSPMGAFGERHRGRHRFSLAYNINNIIETVQTFYKFQGFSCIYYTYTSKRC